MRSLSKRLSHSLLPRRVAITLFALACISIATSCHRKDRGNNDVGSEFRGAAARGDLTKVQALLQGHPNLVSSKNRIGATALHWAAANDHKDVAEFLLSNKANINAKTADGSTPLHWATFNDHKDVVELLLANHAMSMPRTTTAIRLCMQRRQRAAKTWLSCC